MKKIEAMTDEELIDSLSKDWLDRDGDSFVKIRKTGRLGWEATLEKGTPYSSYLLGTPTMDELILRAYPLAKQVISAMDAPFKVNVKLSHTVSCTESKNVYIATDYFDDMSIPTGKKLDIFLGMTAHEGSHLLYTDFSVMSKAQKVHPLCGNILNIIEDERIERLLGEEKPGLANYLCAVKEHVFGRYLKSSESLKCDSPVKTMINMILGLIRYPVLLRKEDMVEYGKMLMKVKEILTPYPDSSASAEAAAEMIYHLIRSEYEMPSEDHAAKPDESACGGSSSDKVVKGSGERPVGRDFESDYSKVSESLGEVASAPVQPDISGCRSDVDTSSEVMKEGGLLPDRCEGIAEVGSTHDTVFTRASEDKEKYMKALSAVKGLIPAVSRSVKGRSKEYKMVHMGMRSGLLDTGKLVEAVQGVPTVYMRNGKVRSDRATVCILIDESGSMVREGRMTAARQTAVLLNEALSCIPNIELFIYGHSADEKLEGRTDIRIYREKGYAPRYALGSLEARDNNRDGVAILETAMRVRKQTDEEVLMYIISDGAPAAQGYIGPSAIKHTRDSVKTAEKMGFRIVQICINACYAPETMFSEYITMEDLSNLAHDLSRTVSRILSKKVRTYLE